MKNLNPLNRQMKFKRMTYKIKNRIQYPFIVFRNYLLVRKYPFLKPSCGWGIDMRNTPDYYKYHYEITWLDCLPKGWKKAFGKQICDELKDAIESNHLSNYKVLQVKEKYGTLRWYDEGGNKNTCNIIDKYEKISEKVCQLCGKPATHMSKGWIGYYCEDCIKYTSEENRIKIPRPKEDDKRDIFKKSTPYFDLVKEDE